MPEIQRCKWTSRITDEEYLKYHDEEWSEPHTDDRALFELLCLEGAQAGLSWQTILKKRKNYRRVFHNFHIDSLLTLGDSDLNTILSSGGVVKHFGKIKSVVQNAAASKKIIKEFGTLYAYFSSFLTDINVSDPSITQSYDDLVCSS
jgi:DNA-3-methyladenine glycosylase I